MCVLHLYAVFFSYLAAISVLQLTTACLPDWLYTLHAYSMLYLHAYILRERAINLTFFLANAEEEEAYVYYYAIFVVTFSASPRATIPRDAARWWSYSTTQPDARKKVKS